MLFVVTAVLLTISLVSAGEECAKYTVTERWRNGWKGHLLINIPKDTKSWQVDATFDNPIQSGDFWAGQKKWTKKSVKVIGNDWSAKQMAGKKFDLGFTVNYRPNGPAVDFKSVKITLCWADGSGCDTCDLFAEECSGGFITGDGMEKGMREGMKNGQLAVMPAKCYKNMPDFTLTFTDAPEFLTFSDLRLKSECKGKVCVVSAENYPLEFNELLLIPVSFPANLDLVGIEFEGKDLCMVKPEKLPEPDLEPTLEPHVSPVPEDDHDLFQQYAMKAGCAQYIIDSTWPNGWKGLINIPIAKDTRNWRLDVQFNRPVVADFWAGLPEKWNSIRTKAIVLGQDWSAEQKAGTIFKTGFTANHDQGKFTKITKMSLKLCWKEGGCHTCSIVQKACTNGLVKLPKSRLSNRIGSSVNVDNNVIEVKITECAEDMDPIKMEFENPIRSLVVPRGRYYVEHNDSKTVWTIKTEKPMRVKKDTVLKIRTQIIKFSGQKGSPKIIDLNYAERNICHSS